MSNMNKSVVLVDMDCFFVQIEQMQAPETFGKPAALVAHRSPTEAMIFAVNYEARSFKLRPTMSLDHAKRLCPDLHVFGLEEEEDDDGRQGLSKYKTASNEVFKTMANFGAPIERASIDEAYFDVTDMVNKRIKADTSVTADSLQNSYIIGYEESTEDTSNGTDRFLGSCLLNKENQRLAVSGVIAEEIRSKILLETGYKCSAGVAHNKILAKLICGLHKPNKQTLLPQSMVSHLYKTTPVHKIQGFGGKFGSEIKDKLNIELMAELEQFSEEHLQKLFGIKSGSYLFRLGKGLDNDPVIPKHLWKSIARSKNFPGKQALNTCSMIFDWVQNLSRELCQKLEEDKKINKRIAQLMTVSASNVTEGRSATSSHSKALPTYDVDQIISDTFNILKKFNVAKDSDATWNPPVTNITISVSNFRNVLDSPSIKEYLKRSEICKSSTDTKSSDAEQNPAKIGATEENSNNNGHMLPIEQDLQITTMMNESSSVSDRLVILVDMDCFYVQVEQIQAPEFLGKPAVVVQYNPYLGGGIIAVNYEARNFGVTRQMRGDEAKKHCPDLHFFQVPEIRGKANITKYREAGAQVMKVLSRFGDCVERASVDEAYLDVTKLVDDRVKNNFKVTAEMLSNTFVVGYEDLDEGTYLDSQNMESSHNQISGIPRWLTTSCLVNPQDHRLAVAGVLAEEIRAAVYDELRYRCSAGVAHNKILAKLTCGLHKPNKQTLLPQNLVAHLYKTIPIHKVRSLGGKLGDVVKTKLDIKLMSELSGFCESALQRHFGEKNGTFLYNLGKGIDYEPVNPRQFSKSIGCGKQFPGKTALSTRTEISKWLDNLADELIERLKKDQEMNKRKANLLTVSVCQGRSPRTAQISRSTQLQTYSAQKIRADALKILEKLNTSKDPEIWQPPLSNLSMAASKFRDCLESSSADFKSFFVAASSSLNTSAASTSRASEVASSSIKLSEKCEVLGKGGSGVIDGKETVNEVLGVDETSRKSASDSSLSPSKGFFAQKARLALESVKTDNPGKVDSGLSFQITKFLPKNSKETGTPSNSHLKNEPVKYVAKPAGISKYFSKQNELNINQCDSDNNDSTAILPLDDFSYRCPECGKVVLLENIEEHTDYHFALNMEKELNKELKKSVKISTSTKRPSSKGTKQQTKKRKGDDTTRPLEFYMKQKP